MLKDTINKISILIIMSLALSSCNEGKRTFTSNTDEISIYKTIIEQFIEDATKNFGHDYLAGKNIFVSDSTTLYFLPQPKAENWNINREVNSIKHLFPDASTDLFHDFESNNANQIKLYISGDIRGFKMFPADSIRSIKKKTNNRWQYLRNKYADFLCILRFSRIGFNDGNNQALVYMDYMYDGLAGAGNYILLKKRDGMWAITKWEEVWVS